MLKKNENNCKYRAKKENPCFVFKVACCVWIEWSLLSRRSNYYQTFFLSSLKVSKKIENNFGPHGIAESLLWKCGGKKSKKQFLWIETNRISFFSLLFNLRKSKTRRKKTFRFVEKTFLNNIFRRSIFKSLTGLEKESIMMILKKEKQFVFSLSFAVQSLLHKLLT